MAGRSEQAIEPAACREGAQMTPMKWTAGCFVILAAVAGGLVSSKILNADFPTKTLEGREISARMANPPNRNLAKRDEDGDQIAQRGHCVTLESQRFEWHWANVPFAALSCSH